MHILDWGPPSDRPICTEEHMTDVIDWLLTSGEPWTRYRTYLDLAERPADDPDVQAAQ